MRHKLFFAQELSPAATSPCHHTKTHRCKLLQIQDYLRLLLPHKERGNPASTKPNPPLLVCGRCRAQIFRAPPFRVSFLRACLLPELWAPARDSGTHFQHRCSWGGCQVTWPPKKALCLSASEKNTLRKPACN